MQDYNDNNQNRNRQTTGKQNVNRQNTNRQAAKPVQREGQPRRDMSARISHDGAYNEVKHLRKNVQPESDSRQRSPQRAAGNQGGQQRPPQRAAGSQGSQQRLPQRAAGSQGSQQRPPQRAAGSGQQRSPQRAAGGKQRTQEPKTNKKQLKNITPQQAAKKKRRKIVLFIAEIFLLLILVGALWLVNQSNKILRVEIGKDDVIINPGVGTVGGDTPGETPSKISGYRNIAIFGVDSREGQLEKSTRTDTIIIASINLDTKEIRLISVLRDTWLNMSTDSYAKANAAYAKGGPKQAISMLNMNLDMNITDFVTVGFDGVMDIIDAVGGVEIDVKEAEIVHLNSFQISMSGKEDGTLNSAGEPNYTAREGIDYIPVTRSGLQTLNGLQATAYMRIRYVGNDFERTLRQRTVITKVAKKAITLNPNTLNGIAEAVFPKVATSLEMSEILSLLAGIASYEIGDNASFPFDGYVQTTRVGKASVVAPVDLEKNVSLLHEFLFDDAGYEPTEVVKKCSEKIASDTGVSYTGQ